MGYGAWMAGLGIFLFCVWVGQSASDYLDAKTKAIESCTYDIGK